MINRKGLRVGLKKKRKKIREEERVNGDIYKKEKRKKEHVVTRDNRNACKRKGYTSNSCSLSKMG